MLCNAYCRYREKVADTTVRVTALLTRNILERNAAKEVVLVVTLYNSDVFWPCIIVYTYFIYQIECTILYSLTICMLHYNPRHISSVNMPIFRRTNCIITASDIVTLCKRLYSMPDESRQSLFSSGILYWTVQRGTISDAVIIQFVLLKMGMLMLETCRGL
jgi:hypothetical protein